MESRRTKEEINGNLGYRFSGSILRGHDHNWFSFKPKIVSLMSDEEWILKDEEWVCSNCGISRKLVSPNFGRNWISTSNGARTLSGFERIMSGASEIFDTSCPCRIKS